MDRTCGVLSAGVFDLMTWHTPRGVTPDQRDVSLCIPAAALRVTGRFFLWSSPGCQGNTGAGIGA